MHLYAKELFITFVGERPRADDSATEQASTYSAVPVLLAEPSATSLALPAPVQVSISHCVA